MSDRKRVVCHPGIYIKEAIEELGLNQSEFALRTGLSIKNVSTLISGDSNVTFDVALKLSAFFGNSVEGWINLQTQYDLFMNEEARIQSLNEDWNIAKKFDKEFMRECLDIEIDSKNKEGTIDALKKAFSVGSLQSLKNIDMYAFCKTSVNKDINEDTIIMRNAWISVAEKRARDIVCSTFDKERIINNVKYLRSLTLEHPRSFEPKLKKFLADSGVKLVILPYLSKSNVTGVTKWLSNENCVMVAVNDCGKDADKIWFAIFHELGHAIKNHKRHLTISYKKDQIMDQDEIEANQFARDSLIDADSYSEFIKNKSFDLRSIQKFALSQQVADFIVIGRLQKDELVPWSKFQNRKIKYEVIA